MRNRRIVVKSAFGRAGDASKMDVSESLTKKKKKTDGGEKKDKNA